MLSVANSCHYNENFKNGRHRLLTNARPSGAAPTNPAPPGKKLDAKAPGWGQIFGANPRGCAGGWLWMKLIPALLSETIYLLRFQFRTLIQLVQWCDAGSS